MNTVRDEMLDEYDLTGKKGIRGKYHKLFGQGYDVRVENEDGTISEQYFASIAPDVHVHFPDSESVNKALRSLIS